MEGTPNLHCVSDDLYRGAQPDEAGFRLLRKLGVRTIVSFRAAQDGPVPVAEGMTSVHIPLAATHCPDDRQVVQFLRLFSDRRNLPVFVHCRLGADRAGMMCALYRVAVQGWTKRQAIDEMTRGGFGYHASFDDLVEYVQNADIARLRREANLPASTAPSTRVAATNG